MATKFVEQYQKERLEQETDQWQKERQKFMEELKEELETLEKKRNERLGNYCADDRYKRDKKFLRYVLIKFSLDFYLKVEYDSLKLYCYLIMHDITLVSYHM